MKELTVRTKGDHWEITYDNKVYIAKSMKEVAEIIRNLEV